MRCSETSFDVLAVPGAREKSFCWNMPFILKHTKSYFLLSVSDVSLYLFAVST